MMKIVEKLKKPSKLLIFLSVLITIIGAVISLLMVSNNYNGFLSYIAYALTAIALAYTIYIIVINFSKIKNGIMSILKSNKYSKIIVEDYNFRTILSSFFSFIVNIGFIIFNAIFAFLTKNIWYASLSIYYLILSITKGITFILEKKAKQKANNEEEHIMLKNRNYGIYGISVLFLDFLMIGVIVLMLLNQKPSNYTNILAIAYAAFSVYKISFAIFNTIKAHRIKDTYIQALRNIALIDAGIALLSLQNALVTTFSDGSDMTILNLLVGIAIWIFSILIGANMIIKSKRKDGKFNEGN